MRFFRTSVFFSLFIFCTPYFSYASFPKSQQAGADITNTYGFLLGQSIALERVETHYPDMAGQVIVAEASFNAAFPLIQERLREIMIDFNGVDHLERVEAEGLAMLKSNLEQQPMTRELAETIVQTIRNRAEGVMESPAREILLATHYMDKPAEEVRDDFYQPFESEGHPKAQGLQLGLRLPVSWVADEGRRPHIVQKWRNLGGYGHTTIMLDIRDAGGEVSDTEVLNFVESGEVRYSIPEGAEFLQASVTQIDAKTAYRVDYIYRQNIGDKIILLQARQYQLFFDGMAIGIQCQTISGVGQGPLDFVSEEDARIFITEESEKQSGVCQQVAHSLVLYQAW